MGQTSVDSLARELVGILEEYGHLTAEVLNQSIEKVSKSTKQKVAETSPRFTGTYSKNWKIRTVEKTSDRRKDVVYAGNGEHRITHLLENGHAKRGGGRVSGTSHIRPAEEAAVRELIELLKEGIG